MKFKTRELSLQNLIGFSLSLEPNEDFLNDYQKIQRYLKFR